MKHPIPEDAPELRRIRDRLWNRTEWTRVAPPKDQKRRGEVRFAGLVTYANKASGEIG